VAAAFGALLGTPFAGVVVAVSLQRRLRPLVVVCSLIAGFVGNRIVIACGYERETAPELPSVDWSVRWVAALVVVGVVCGVAARLFDLSMHRLRSRVAQLVAWPPLRPVVGGTATVVLALLVGRDYLGLSVPLLGDAFNGDAGWEDAAWKLVFTVIALATGFVGGEMVPLFVVGSALGAAVGTAFGLPVAVLVAVGFVTVFSAATTLTLFGIVAAVELFGWATLAPAVIAGLVARAIAGRPGLYLTKADLDQARDEL
jgi:H+/Cl- antiporter ClcA